MRETVRIADFMARASREVASLVTRRIGLATLTGVVLRTPVDTGRARGAWQVGLGAAPPDRGEQLDKSGGSTVSAGAAVIAAQRDYGVVVIENNLPYITRLNDGSSSQAPAGYVEAVLSEQGLGTSR